MGSVDETQSRESAPVKVAVKSPVEFAVDVKFPVKKFSCVLAATPRRSALTENSLAPDPKIPVTVLTHPSERNEIRGRCRPRSQERR